MFTERRARSREAEISLEISANVTSSKSRALGLEGIALALVTRVLELFFITFNVSAARNAVTPGRQLSCRPLPGFGRGRDVTPMQQIESVAVLGNKPRGKGAGGCLMRTGEGPKDKSHDRMSVDMRRELND